MVDWRSNPKHVYDGLTKTYRWKLNLGKNRSVPKEALLPRPVLERLRGPGYSPSNLPTFKASVRALPSIPDSLPYAP